MGKRNFDAVVLLSSDDEVEGAHGRSRHRKVKSEPRRNAGRKKSRCPRRASVPYSRFLAEPSSIEEDVATFFPSDLCEDILHFTSNLVQGKIKSSIGDSGFNQLWIDKYKPRSLMELAVHRNKVNEVKLWLEKRLTDSKKNCGDNVLVVTGLAGIGKSATVYAIASNLGAEVCEWKTPTPTIWHEFNHSTKSGLRYMSKLDDFEAFVERIQKYPLLPSASDGISRKAVVLLIDDLPLTSRRDSCGRLCKCLQWLAQSAQYPTIISITECGKFETDCATSYYGEVAVSYLERFGVPKVMFNPITVNSIKRVLAKICKEEEVSISPAWIDHIAKGSGGDIRNAIMSLQYYSLRVDLLLSSPLSSLAISHPKNKSDDNSGCFFSNSRSGYNFDEGHVPFIVGRDETLSLFHGLGKFLHNKRDMIPAVGNGDDCFPLRKELVRFPLKMDSPEKIFSQVHGEARQVLEFLHENVLDFLCDEGVDDAFMVASYFSDADGLLANSSASRMTTPGRFDPASLPQSVAASIAIRGVLFGNSQPSSSRWHSIRSPKLWQVEQSLQWQKKGVLEKRLETCSNFTSSSLSVFAAEFKPSLRWLEHRAAISAETDEGHVQPWESREGVSDWARSGTTLISGSRTICDFPDEELEESEDEIEDW